MHREILLPLVHASSWTRQVARTPDEFARLRLSFGIDQWQRNSDRHSIRQACFSVLRLGGIRYMPGWPGMLNGLLAGRPQFLVAASCRDDVLSPLKFGYLKCVFRAHRTEIRLNLTPTVQLGLIVERRD